jgi:glucose/arabinose dehydrogenase
VALPDENNDGKADKTVPIITGLNNPHGLLVRCMEETACQLYVAETDAVSVYDYDPAAMTASNRREIIALPSDGGHFTRTLATTMVDGEEKLLISVGSSCNVCLESDARRASILVSDLDGGNLITYARGLRNSVFMAKHPVTGEIWATENGRDWLGDDLPPDEINVIKENGNYGWPICYGQNIHDGEFDKNTYIRNPCMEPFESPSHIDLQAHSAALGIGFFGPDWPEEYRYDALVAFHGSWNRSVPTGYKVARLKLDTGGNFLGMEDFISGWMTAEGAALGRPVAILVRPDGIFISDDKAGVVYRCFRHTHLAD